MERYDSLIIKSKEIWEESISGGGYQRKKEKEPEAQVQSLNEK